MKAAIQKQQQYERLNSEEKIDYLAQIWLVSALPINHHKVLRLFAQRTLLLRAAATCAAFDLIEASLTQIGNKAHAITVVILIIDADIVLPIPAWHVS